MRSPDPRDRLKKQKKAGAAQIQLSAPCPPRWAHVRIPPAMQETPPEAAPRRAPCRAPSPCSSCCLLHLCPLCRRASAACRCPLTLVPLRAELPRKSSAASLQDPKREPLCCAELPMLPQLCVRARASPRRPASTPRLCRGRLPRCSCVRTPPVPREAAATAAPAPSGGPCACLAPPTPQEAAAAAFALRQCRGRPLRRPRQRRAEALTPAPTNAAGARRPLLPRERE